MRRINTLNYMAVTLLYNGVVIYAPALALEQATNLNVYLGILLTGGICMFYTTLGGLKAVVWTDSLQTRGM